MCGELKWAGRVVLTVVAMVLAVAGGACAKVIYVDDDAPPGGDGSSWTTAYTFLQDALAEATATEETIEIRIARGIYRPDRDATHPNGTGDRTASFFLANDTTLRGGYAGLGAAEPNDRDVQAYETILSGDLAGNDVLSEDSLDFVEDPNEGNWPRPDVWCLLIESTRQENCLHVVTSRGVDQTAILEGVTITGGHAYSPPYWFGRSSTVIFGEDDRGGALLHAGGHPTLKTCLFVANSAMGGGGAIYTLEGGTLDMEECRCLDDFAWSHGGAVFAATDGVLAMRRCHFERDDTWAGDGAAIYTSECQHELVECSFVENSQTRPGKAVLYARYATGTLDRCVLSVNKGNPVNTSGELAFTDCTFRGNLAYGYGGGIYLSGDSRLYRCVFVGNQATQGGSAVAIVGGGAVLIACDFWDNRITSSVNFGDGGCVLMAGSDPSLIGCCFHGNASTPYGGAILVASGDAAIRNCTFSRNRAVERGGVLYTRSDGVVSIVNSVFWENEAPEGSTIAIKRSPATVSVSYSLLEDGQAGISPGANGILNWGSGNIDADPRFADPAYWDVNGTPDDPNDDFFVEGDYHLRSQAGRWDPVSAGWIQDDVTSPCIDGGDPNSAVAFEPYPNGGLVNMGAYGGTVEASKSDSGLHAVYGGGSGTTADPYLIYTAEHLSALGASVEDWNAHFRLMADVDLGSYPPDSLDIIGRYDESEPFTGTFDGNGHTIANFRYAGPETNGAGLFGYVTRDTAEIANLTLASPSVDGGAGESCGSLVGYLGRGTIRDCRVAGAVVAGGRNVGALVGYNWAATMAGCSAAGRVAGSQNVGGLLGGNRSGTVSECCAAVAVSGQDDVGGLVGDTSGGAILRCYAAGTVSGSGADIGGLVADNAGILRDCYCTAGVEAGPYTVSVGGLVGENTGGATIDNCYATGRVVAGTGAREVGGLVGRNGGAVSHCFWDTQATGQTTSADGAGKTSAEMQMPETFLDADWDFVDETENGADDVWHLLEPDYPRLTWELLAELH